MIAKTHQGNAVRDERYRQIFNEIQRNRGYLEDQVGAPEVLWKSEIAAHIDAAGKNNGYRSGRKTSTSPDLFVIGYDAGCMERITSFLESMALQRIFQDCSILMEGYDGTAALLSKVKPVTNPQLNSLFARHYITPQGKDNFYLREKQYTNLQKNEINTSEQNILEAIDCLVKRERDYFAPAIVEMTNKRKPIIFLTNIVHALSTNFPIVLNNNGVTYAIFVPNPLK